MKGITYDKARNQWRVRATVDGKEVYIGRFDNEAEAVAAHVAFLTKQHEKEIMSYEFQAYSPSWLEVLHSLKARVMKRNRDTERKLEAYNDEKLKAL